MKSRFVVLAPTLEAARRLAGKFSDARPASPRATRALGAALASGAPVVVADPPRRDAGWEAEKRRILLPGAPGLLRDAIGGIASIEPAGPPAAGGGPARARWIPGDLTDRRARAILEEPPGPRLWIVEDFRRVRLSAAARRRLERAGIRLAAFRALRRIPLPPRRPGARGKMSR